MFVLAASVEEPEANQPFFFLLLLMERGERFLFSSAEVGSLVSSSLQCNKLEEEGFS